MARHIYINYTLHGATRNYRGITEAIAALEKHSAKKLMETSWIVLTDLTVEQVYNHMREYIDTDDQFFVVTLGRDAQFSPGFAPDVKNWLSAHFR